jgi:exosortase/archaeosortase family protein
LPTALFVSAIVAFPVTMRSKWSAILVGTGALLTINLVRIITLYYTRIHRPDWFHAMHVDVWQPAFIFLALFFWVVWALRATRPPAVQHESQT